MHDGEDVRCGDVWLASLHVQASVECGAHVHTDRAVGGMLPALPWYGQR